MKTLINLSILFLITIFLSSCGFAPGSYPYAEEYEVNLDEKSLIKAMQDFKKNNPEYIPPEQTMLKDGRRDSTDYWYHIYFYFKDDNKLINTWVRADTQNKTTFAFVGVNEGLTLGNWKYINRDFNSVENENYKRKFKEKILNNLVLKKVD